MAKEKETPTGEKEQQGRGGGRQRLSESESEEAGKFESSGARVPSRIKALAPPSSLLLLFAGWGLFALCHFL